MSEPTTTKRPRFVSLTDTVRLPLSEGDWIEVRRSLSWGQRHDLINAYSQIHEDGTVSVDALKIAPAELRAYLTDWSFTEPATGDRVPINEQTIYALAEEAAVEIVEALRRHLNAQQAAAPKVESSAVPPSP
jgi:hypothetical protein